MLGMPRLVDRHLRTHLRTHVHVCTPRTSAIPGQPRRTSLKQRLLEHDGNSGRDYSKFMSTSHYPEVFRTVSLGQELITVPNGSHPFPESRSRVWGSAVEHLFTEEGTYVYPCLKGE